MLTRCCPNRRQPWQYILACSASRSETWLVQGSKKLNVLILFFCPVFLFQWGQKNGTYSCSVRMWFLNMNQLFCSCFTAHLTQAPTGGHPWPLWKIHYGYYMVRKQLFYSPNFVKHRRQCSGVKAYMHGNMVNVSYLSGHSMGWDSWCAPWMALWLSWISRRMNWEIPWMKRKRWRKCAHTDVSIIYVFKAINGKTGISLSCTHLVKYYLIN